jgi:hypothetical protein
LLSLFAIFEAHSFAPAFSLPIFRRCDTPLSHVFCDAAGDAIVSQLITPAIVFFDTSAPPPLIFSPFDDAVTLIAAIFSFRHYAHRRHFAISCRHYADSLIA